MRRDALDRVPSDPYPPIVETPIFPQPSRHAMDFIERWFGWSPDGGNGSFELLIVFAACVAGCFLLYGISSRLRANVNRLLDRARRATRKPVSY
jgi:hypothetical protein